MMMLNLAKGEDFCVCVCTSGDLLNRPRFQFHASEFDRGRERGRETEREGPQPVMFPQGGRTKGWREGGKEVKGDEEAGGKGDKVGE